MFVEITNTPRPYGWGSTTAIAEALRREASGRPEAELWLGEHPGSPARIIRPSEAGGAETLADWIAADPATTLGRFAADGRLPFLLKLLAAASPLSLQAHPTPEQAAAGFARENAEGIPVDAPHRNYRDAFPKPELIYALSDTFDALCGFRALDQSREIVRALRAEAGDDRAPFDDLLRRAESDDALPALVEWLSNGGADVERLVDLVSQLAPVASGFPAEFETVGTLAAEYPGDPGIVISLLLNRVTLARGEALYLPAGNIHAYLAGLGVELMAASDNVLRGGLTPKHVDVPELLSVLDFTAVPVPYLRPSHPSAAVELFTPDVPDFRLFRVTGDATVDLDGPAIALCTGGAFEVPGEAAITRGQSFYLTPDVARLRVTGDGELFIATTG